MVIKPYHISLHSDLQAPAKTLEDHLFHFILIGSTENLKLKVCWGLIYLYLSNFSPAFSFLFI